jgi:hypothetical protein
MLAVRESGRRSTMTSFAGDQQINRSKKLSTGPDIFRNPCYKRHPTHWRFNDGFEEKTGEAARMVEQGPQ